MTLASAASLDQLFDAAVEVLESGEFVYAEAELTCNSHVEVNHRAFELAIQMVLQSTQRLSMGIWNGVGKGETVRLPASWIRSSFG